MSTGSGNDAMDAMHTLAVLVSRALNTLNPNPALAQTVYKLAQSHPSVESFHKAIAVFGRFSLQQVQSSLLHFRGGVPRELTTPSTGSRDLRFLPVSRHPRTRLFPTRRSRVLLIPRRDPHCRPRRPRTGRSRPRGAHRHRQWQTRLQSPAEERSRTGQARGRKEEGKGGARTLRCCQATQI
jgi:hypothetical protein